MKILITSLLASVVVVGQALAADPAALARGKTLYENWCSTCHAPDPREDGRLLPGTNTLHNKYQGSKPAALEERTDLLPPYVEFIIRRGSHAMPQFRKSEITDAEMHDISAYLDKSAGSPRAGAPSFLEPYFGNTFVSRHGDGVEYRVLYSADGRFELTRSGGPDRSADYQMNGTYTVEGSQVCFHAANPPSQALSCVPQDQGHKAGESWDISMPDGGHATHMIVAGLVPRGPLAN